MKKSMLAAALAAVLGVGLLADTAQAQEWNSYGSGATWNNYGYNNWQAPYQGRRWNNYNYGYNYPYGVYAPAYEAPNPAWMYGMWTPVGGRQVPSLPNMPLQNTGIYPYGFNGYGY